MKRLFAFLLIMMIMISVGCSKSAETTSSEATPSETPVEDMGWSSEFYDAEGMKDVTLNMYAVTDNVRGILDAFTEDTGIKVENLTLKNGEILQRLTSEKEAGVAIADLWFTGGADTFIDGAKKGLLYPYVSPEAAVLDAKMKDADGYWHGTSLTIVNWVVNTELLKEKGLEIPGAWDDLLDPALKGQVSMSDPASSGTAFNVVSSMLELRGETEGWAYLDKLIPQVPFFTPRGSDPANMVVNGEAIVGINASNGDRDLEVNNPHIKLVYPSDGTGWWPQPVAIVEGTKNIDASKVFIDWILSKRGMAVMAEVRNAAVARTDVERPEGIIDINTIKLFDTDFQANAEKRDAILGEWKKRVQ